MAGYGLKLRDRIARTANSIGMSPVDLASIISYETAGTFDPTKAGPRTQWGQHRGLIQFGEPQAKQYGVDWNNPVDSQLGENGAVANYFRKNGWKPGMGLLDAYSIVNAGAPGRYNASDANNGGAPGTVRDKVNNQFAGHIAKAKSLFSDFPDIQATAYAPEPKPMMQDPKQKAMMQALGMQQQPQQSRNPLVKFFSVDTPMSQQEIERRQANVDALQQSSRSGQITHPLEGVAKMTDALFAGLQQRKLNKAEEYNRKVMMELLGGGNTEFNPEQIGRLAAINPEAAARLREQQLGRQYEQQQLADKRAYDQQLLQDNRAYEQQQYGQQRQDALSDYEAKQRIDQQYASPKLTTDQQNYQAAQADPGFARYQKDLSAKGGDKPPSGFRWTDDTQSSLEPIPGGPGEQISGELAARLGMAESFIDNMGSLRQRVGQGMMDGLGDRIKWGVGIGEPSEVYKDWQSGTDALQRMLTGAGMPISEAQNYASRYLPQQRDTREVMLGKLDRLQRELEYVSAMAKRGRGGQPKPNSSNAKPNSVSQPGVIDASEYFK